MKVAKYWMCELQKMAPDQQLLAKKAINDIIHEGLMNNLSRNCVKIVTQKSYPPLRTSNFPISQYQVYSRPIVPVNVPYGNPQIPAMPMEYAYSTEENVEPEYLDEYLEEQN